MKQNGLGLSIVENRKQKIVFTFFPKMEYTQFSNLVNDSSTLSKILFCKIHENRY